jgi:hypothetical protein
MDWLEAHSPMKINWMNKWILINCARSNVQLYGVQATLPELSVVGVMLINEVEAAQRSMSMITCIARAYSTASQ